MPYILHFNPTMLMTIYLSLLLIITVLSWQYTETSLKVYEKSSSNLSNKNHLKQRLVELYRLNENLRFYISQKESHSSFISKSTFDHLLRLSDSLHLHFVSFGDKNLEFEGRFFNIIHFLRCLEVKGHMRFLEHVFFHKKKSRNNSESLHCQIRLRPDEIE